MDRLSSSGSSGLPVWRDYLDFHLKLGQDFWFDRIDELPYGRLLVGATCFLFCGDLRQGRFGDILFHCQDVAAGCGARLSFFFSPETLGDEKEFCAFLAKNGYRKDGAVMWLSLDPSQGLFFPNRLVRRGERGDEAALGRIYDSAFGDDLAGRKPFLDLVTQSRVVVRDRVFVLRDDVAGEDVGMVACAYDNRFGYVHDLAVLPDFRQRGYGRILMSHALAVMADEQVEAVVSAADVANMASVELHKRRGYQPFATTETWGL